MIKLRMLTATLMITGSLTAHAALETTTYGKIVGFETRSWGMHVQVDFAAGHKLGCPVTPGQTYMLDLSESNISKSGGNFEFSQAVILSAFMAQKDVSFHLYECGTSRPYIGYIRVKH